MLSRGFAICSILALTTVVQGGVTVQLVPSFCPGGTCDAGTCTGGTRAGQPCAATCFPTNAVVDVDVTLVQDAGGSDQRLRMVEFDMTDTSSLLGVQLLDTHNRGTPGTGDDIKFWFFGSLNNCVTTPSFCSFNHYTDFARTAGVVDSRLDMLSIAFQGLNPDLQAQLLLQANQTPLVVGKLRVTTPGATGSFLLSLSNADDTGADRGARVDFGFDPHVIWRARNASPNQVSGGTLNFEVSNSCPSGTVNFVSSVPLHTAVAAYPNPVPTGSTFWRSAGNVGRLTFSGTIPALPAAGQVLINELLPVPPNAAPGFGADVSASFAFSLENGPNGNNSVLRLRDGLVPNTPTANLGHRKWYAIRGVGWPGVTNFEVHFPIQAGDATADNRVLQSDILEINTGISCVVNCGDQNRKDITGDGRVLQSDILEANTKISSLPVAKPVGH